MQNGARRAVLDTRRSDDPCLSRISSLAVRTGLRSAGVIVGNLVIAIVALVLRRGDNLSPRTTTRAHEEAGTS